MTAPPWFAMSSRRVCNAVADAELTPPPACRRPYFFSILSLGRPTRVIPYTPVHGPAVRGGERHGGHRRYRFCNARAVGAGVAAAHPRLPVHDRRTAGAAAGP